MHTCRYTYLIHTYAYTRMCVYIYIYTQICVYIYEPSCACTSRHSREHYHDSCYRIDIDVAIMRTVIISVTLIVIINIMISSISYFIIAILALIDKGKASTPLYHNLHPGEKPLCSTRSVLCTAYIILCYVILYYTILCYTIIL